MEIRLGNIKIFKFINIFRRKASINLSIEKKRLVGIDNKGLLSIKDTDKSIKNKRRRRLKVID